MSILTFQYDGVEIRKSILSEQIIREINAEINLDHEKLKKYGVRNLEKKFESISKLSKDRQIVSIASNLLGGSVNLVRAIFFDKTPNKNWYVTWHQDKTVTLNQMIDLEGWGPWTIKDGIHHVQPPLSVLEKMVTLRLHLDPSNEDNGCLRVIPGSHKYGILNQSQIDEIVGRNSVSSCVVEASDAVIMRPHILHSSRKSKNPYHRRVVHLEYSNYELPSGVTWA